MKQASVVLCRVAPVGLAVLLCIVAPLSRAEPEPVTITLAESSVSVPVTLSYIARDKGFWRDEGLEVRLASFTAGRLALDALVGGGAQFATVAQSPLAVAAFSTDEFSIIAEISNSPDELGVIARRSAGILKPADLKGKTIAYFAGTQTDYFLSLFLQSHGMSRADVKALSLSPPDSVLAIKNGDVDAMIAWRPHSLNALKVLALDGVSLPADGLHTSIMTMIANRRYAEQNPETVRRVVRGLIAAERFVKENPEQAIRIVANQVQIDEEFLRSFFSRYDFQVRLSDNLVGTLKKEGQWAIDSGLRPVSAVLPDYRIRIDAAPLTSVDLGRVSISFPH